MALNHNGSLPVSYIPDGLQGTNKVDKAISSEAGAYNFFSSLNNPCLIRVNQYAALYQIFSRFRITNKGVPNTTNIKKTVDADGVPKDIIKNYAISVFKKMLEESDEEFKDRMVN